MVRFLDRSKSVYYFCMYIFSKLKAKRRLDENEKTADYTLRIDNNLSNFIFDYKEISIFDLIKEEVH